MNSKARLLILIGIIISAVVAKVIAYPPAVGILGKSQNCLNCHVDNGGWVDGSELIIDIVDMETKTSLKQPDGSFLLKSQRGKSVTVLTIIGYKTDNEDVIPYRNAWLYVDPDRINTSALSKFPAGWDVNLPMACRIVGDKLDMYPDAYITALPMTIRPTDAANNATVTLQVMLTKGETVKGNPRQGMKGRYFERILHLKVEE